MAERAVSDTLNVGFDAGAGDDADIMLERSTEYTGENPYEGWQAVREFPVLYGITRYASVGEVKDTHFVYQLTRKEFLTFEGDDSATTKYPIMSNMTVLTEVVFAVDEEAHNIPAYRLSFTYDHQKKTVKANRPFWGAIRIEYFTQYRLLAYRPILYTESAAGGLNSDAYFSTYGTILCFYNKKSVTLDMDPEPLADWNLYKELYTVTSVVQVNESGPWEKHPDFDTGGGWSDTSSPRDGDSIFEYDRPHELGFLRRGTGRVDFQTKAPFVERGPSGTIFHPVLVCRFHERSDFENTPWQEAYDRVNLDQVRADIQTRWPTVTFP